MIQSKLAEMYIRLESARTFVYRALAACNRMASDEGGRGAIHKLTAAAIYDAADAVKFVQDEAVQIHGGMGYMRESEINRLYRETKVMEIGAGTQEVRKIIIAGELLK
jgi:isovaleryl-CoA dehydrogenase